MKIKITRLVASSTFSVAVFLAGAPMANASMDPVQLSRMIEQDANLKDCGGHKDNASDCHIHDENTYLHIRQNVPKPDHTHAWTEFRNWNKHFRHQHR